MGAQATTARPPAVLRPAVAVVTRFRTSARLLGLIAALLVPGSVNAFAYLATVTAPITFAQRETEGTAVLRPALTAMADTVAGKNADIAGVVAAARASGLDLGTALRALETAAHTPTSGLSPDERAGVVDSLAAVVGAVGDDSNLILDPDLDSFYVMDSAVVQLPRLLVATAHAAAPDASQAVDQRIAAQAVLAGLVSGSADSLSTDRSTALRADGTALSEAQLNDLSPAIAEARNLAEHLTSTLSAPAAAPADHLDAVSSTARAAVEPTVAALDSLLKARIAHYERSRALTIGAALGGLLVAAWFAVAVIWRTKVDVSSAVAGVQALAEGDLDDHPLPDGRDEYGDIGRAVAAARGAMLESREQLAEAAREREEQIQASFVQQATAQAQLRRRAQAVIDETASTVGGQLSEVSNRVAGLQGAASTIDERVGAADAATRAVVGRAEEVRAVLGSLGSSLQQVAGMTRVIAGVADQTKLLALNATIEAARAGETGRGFAVVADEVKNLATTTAEATADVARTVASLETDAAATIATIEAMADGIAEVDDATAVLRSVAVDQRELVDRLGSTLDHAVSRISEMSALTDRLERRHFKRIPIKGKGHVTSSDRGDLGFDVDLVNISRGGLLTSSPKPCPVEEGAIVRLEFPVSGENLQVHASVRRLEKGQQTRLALEFGQMDSATTTVIDAYVRLMDDEDDGDGDVG